MITISRSLEFDAGHRVLGHEGKCRHIHGHRYKAIITVTAPDLNSLGMVTDFSVLKERVGGWIDQFWDHNLILNEQDPILGLCNTTLAETIFGGKQPYVMVDGFNPTAENLARELFKISAHLLADVRELTMRRVRIYETPNCWADCYGFQPHQYN